MLTLSQDIRLQAMKLAISWLHEDDGDFTRRDLFTYALQIEQFILTGREPEYTNV